MWGLNAVLAPEFSPLYQNNFWQLPMEDTYTYDSLVQFLYHEMPAADVVEMAHSIEMDEYLHEEFAALHAAKSQLTKVQFNPSKTTIQNILLYSAQSALDADC